MENLKLLIFVLLAFFAAGCARSHGFNRASLMSGISDTAKPVTDADIRAALDIKAQLPSPFKLAVFFKGARCPWDAEDKDAVFAIAPVLKEKGVISEMVLINEGIVSGDSYDRKNIRLAAARAGADAVLIVNGASEIDRYNNILGPTYILILPMFFIPGTVVDGLYVLHAAMWDVGNDFLYLSVEAEGKGRRIRPSYFAKDSDSDAVNDAKKQAMPLICREITARIANMAGK